MSIRSPGPTFVASVSGSIDSTGISGMGVTSGPAAPGRRMARKEPVSCIRRTQSPSF